MPYVIYRTREEYDYDAGGWTGTKTRYFDVLCTTISEDTARKYVESAPPSDDLTYEWVNDLDSEI